MLFVIHFQTKSSRHDIDIKKKQNEIDLLVFVHYSLVQVRIQRSLYLVEHSINKKKKGITERSVSNSLLQFQHPFVR